MALEFHAMPGMGPLLAGYRPEIADGFIEVPEGPGLGVELDEDEPAGTYGGANVFD